MSTWRKFNIFGAIVLAACLFAASPVLSAQKKVSELTALTGANTASDDDFLVVDTDVTTSKRITRDELAIGLGGPMGIVVESIPGTAATATGTDAIGIGDGAVAGNAANDNAVLAIGASATATGVDSIAIGQNTDATGARSIAIGGDTTDATSADATADDSIAIGSNSLSDAAGGIAIGVAADAGGTTSVAIGDLANASGGAAVAVGDNTDATGANSVAIGGSSIDASSADATSTNAVAIGANSLASNVDTVGLGAGAVGSGNSAVALGPVAIASANRSIAIGRNTDATGLNCIAIGSNVTDADSADCSAADSVAIGQHILADDVGEFAFASGSFSVQSDAHTSVYTLRNQTTDATQTEVFSDGSSASITIGSDCTIVVVATGVGRQTNADAGGAYEVTAVLNNEAGTVALIGSVNETLIAEDVAGWGMTITADDTNDGPNILVTGAASDDVNWVVRVEVTESCG